ncbi:MOSC domain-containing protein, partial [Trifolium medium]|nr:MOSC domain-containing protein [Trifolium medium]
ADDITVWEWTGSAWDEGAEASQWFSDYLGNPTKLVRFNTGNVL